MVAGPHGTLISWRKSTHSGGGGTNCVEVGDSGTNILVRDTNDRDGAVLDMRSTDWEQFISRLKA